jgi:hypothetical protein
VEVGGTVEKYSKKRKERNHKRAAHPQSLLWVEFGTVEKYSFIGRSWNC